ncbi:hypothetical protein COEREDRAFT_5607 [Coemansia reversa NRRL 1564]|uniref:Uncharacterized protein n=1 Tax=Coemansia reversa (strain ATCC 12441 / NRRL 1564) TaxID=763665 RepID=A0A2G5BMD7_COERN|nr:hypothetical protein COEREDRAFT_5607 [Coemansia reversa NRRL 1564]|eukprot:PIA19797.1 hypothetical protein COEREDRAFT_5607 [Coemansia reversa NRRL 1564]
MSRLNELEYIHQLLYNLTGDSDHSKCYIVKVHADSSEEINGTPDITTPSTCTSDEYFDSNGTSPSLPESSTCAGYTTPVYLPYNDAPADDNQNESNSSINSNQSESNGSIDINNITDQLLREIPELAELQLPLPTDVHMPPADSTTDNSWLENESTRVVSPAYDNSNLILQAITIIGRSIDVIAQLQLDAIENDDASSDDDIEMDDDEYMASSESEPESEYDTDMDEDEEMTQLVTSVPASPELTTAPIDIEDNDESNISESLPLAPAVVPMLTSSSESSSGDILTTSSHLKSKRLPYMITSSPNLSPPMLSSPTISPEFSCHTSSAIQVMQQAMQALETTRHIPKRKAIAWLAFTEETEHAPYYSVTPSPKWHLKLFRPWMDQAMITDQEIIEPSSSNNGSETMSSSEDQVSHINPSNTTSHLSFSLNS